MWAAAVVAIGALAGCGGSDGSTGSAPTTPPGAFGNPPGASLPVSAPSTSRTPPSSATQAAAALTCDGLKNSQLDSAAADEFNYPQQIQLVDGAWSGDGLNVSFRECAVGDLDGDGNSDGVASLVFNNGGTGQFYYLAYWHNTGGQPEYVSAVNLGDRTPVEKITVAGGTATVVILTRTPDLPPAATNLRRTATYRLSKSTLVEQGHTDAPYTP
jgi:hypothetical protein